MCLLRVLGSARVHARLLRNALLAVQRCRLSACGSDRLLRKRWRVCPHIGDVAVLIQPLRDAHRLAGRETQLAGRFLLQRRRCEWRGRAARVGLRLNRADRECRRRFVQRRYQCLCRALIEGNNGRLELSGVIKITTGCNARTIQANETGLEVLG